MACGPCVTADSLAGRWKSAWRSRNPQGSEAKWRYRFLSSGKFQPKRDARHGCDNSWSRRRLIMALSEAPVKVRVSAVSRETDDISLLELRAVNGELPAFSAGAHIDLHLSNG